MKILIHIVTYNHERTIGSCIRSLQALAIDSHAVDILVTDNGSLDDSVTIARSLGVSVTVNTDNLGFSGAQNQAVALLLKEYQYLLIVNPDLALEKQALKNLLVVAEREQKIGIVGPLLFRANEQLEAIQPLTYDSCGMCITNSLRHFDIGSNQVVGGPIKTQEVFGITGACLLIKKSCAQALLLPRNQHEESLYQIYPQLKRDVESRPQLFDEGFFAYREDADLALRAKRFAWAAYIVADAHGYHVRKVLPENRAQLSSEINSLGVRNRFLLQINNIELKPKFSLDYFLTLGNGLLLRNSIVLLGVLCVERTSLKGIKELWLLRKRAFANRQYILKNTVGNS